MASTPEQRHACLIALGGNLGDSRAIFEQAYSVLSEHQVHVIRRSSVLQSAPMGQNAGDVFCNAAALVETTHAPAELLAVLHRVELSCGRTRQIHWGPRTLDLDLIAFADQVIDTPQLVVPHPHCWYRRFVLEPVQEISPDWTHPLLQLSATDLLARLNQRPLRLGYHRLAHSMISLAGKLLPPQRLDQFVEFADCSTHNTEQIDDMLAKGDLTAMLVPVSQASDDNLTNSGAGVPQRTQPSHGQPFRIPLDATNPALIAEE
ncbi:MAG: 2-amino-4-hydroxy-6-hydroxymethyldihydropteridine diphosphokinase, partial [Planctomycetaceae bacterium]|nr:2-amino-4-hydroxy-6-hydroxymethyldihydropteridine diphosphokinase [Planctomycetaceae bacterium]